MADIISIKHLCEEQRKLDKTIQDNHHVTYLDTRNERLLALLVELGEFANTTRCFKFWSNKGMEAKEVVLDEAADCLHFYLSIASSGFGNGLSEYATFEMRRYINPVDKSSIVESFRRAFMFASQNSLSRSFEDFLDVISKLGFSWQDLEDAYYKKLGVNYHRQETNY